MNITSDTANDWNPNANGTVRALAVSGDLVYVGGEFSSVGAQDRNRLAALSTGDGLATAWDPNADGTVMTMSWVGSTLYVGGSFAKVGGTARLHAAALDTLTGGVTDWAPTLSTFGASAHLVMTLAAGAESMLVGGNFTSISGCSRMNAAAIDLATGAATAWDPQASAAVNVLAFNNPSVYAGGSFRSIGGQSRSCLAALDAETGLALDWNPVVIGKTPKVSALAFSEDSVFVGGVFTNVGGAKRNGLAKLNLATGTALDWDAAPVGVSASSAPSINTLLLSGEGLYVGGDFAKFGVETRLRIGLLDLQWGNALGWNPMASNALSAMVLADKGLLAGGSFTNIGGKQRNYLAALDTTTGTATTWNPSPNKAVSTVGVAGNSVYVGGTFTSIGGEFRNRLAIVSLITAQSGGWDPNVNDVVRTLIVRPEAVYVGGDFTTVGGKAHRYFAVFPIVTAFLSAPGSTCINTNGEFEATLQVADGQKVTIQASTDLVHWDDIQTNTPAGTNIRLKDPSPASFPCRFYRAVVE